MPYVTAATLKDNYDAIVVGSGAGGGQMAYTLTMAGARVLMIPNDGCFCELDPEVKDRWGIPVLRFHWRWSDHETRQVAHMLRTFTDVFSAMGGRMRSEPATDGAKAIRAPGSIIHEVGGALMGSSPAKSVTNPWGQTWDVPNLVLADGAPFCSNSDKNPTLTLMALAWRAGDHLLEELTKGNI